MSTEASRRSRGPTRWLAGALIVAVLIGVGFWWRASRRHDIAHGALAGWNILLITVDTLRVDRVGVYGGTDLTPAIDRLANGGVQFSVAYAHAPMTLPSHASILTGLTPPGHGVRNNGAFVLSPSVNTLATYLQPRGYRTGAFVGAFVLDARFGLNRGFDRYDDFYGEQQGAVNFGFSERSAERVLQPAADWILGAAGAQASAAPWFAWVHLFDPHAPYRAPEHLRSDPYDNEVAYADRQLGRFLDRLRAARVLDRTLVVVTADHGESLGDHGEATHGLFAYDVVLRVPLLIVAPSLRPAVVDVPAAHVDIVPTVMDLIGLDLPRELHGRSLRDVLGGASGDAAPVYFEALDANLTRNWAPLQGVVADGWKYIDLPIPELYELARDSRETTNLASREARRLDTLDRRLRDVLDRLSEGAPADAPSVALDEESRARLRSLGYTGAPVAPGEQRKTGYTEADDPKTLVELNRQFQSALTLTGEGQLDRAIGQLQEVIRARPDFVTAYTSASSALIEAGRPEGAVDLLQRAPEPVRQLPEIRRHLASALLAANRPAEVVALLDGKTTMSGAELDTNITLGVALAQLGKLDQARDVFVRLLEIDPTSVGTLNNLGIVEMSAGRPLEAAAAFRGAVEIDPTYAPAWQGLGHALLPSDKDGAIVAWRHVVELTPNDFDTLYNLAMVLLEGGNRAEALPLLRRFAAEAPRDRHGPDLVRVEAIIKGLAQPR